VYLPTWRRAKPQAVQAKMIRDPVTHVKSTDVSESSGGHRGVDADRQDHVICIFFIRERKVQDQREKVLVHVGRAAIEH